MKDLETLASPATLELLNWVSSRPRTYSEAMRAWRSHCPRITPWEDALIDGLVTVGRGAESIDEASVTLTEAGLGLLMQVRQG